MVVSIDLCSSSDDEDYISSSPDSKDSYADDEEDISSSSESEDSASDGDYAPSSDDEDSEDSATDGDYADESPLSLDRKENLGSDDPSDSADRSLVLRKAPFGRNYAEHPIFLDDEWWLNSTHASPSYRSPAVSSHRIYPGSSSSLMLHDSSYSNSVKVLNGSDDGDDRVKDEPNDFGRSAANGIGMSSSTFSDDLFGSYRKVETDSNNDNVYAYEGPRSHSTLPPSMQSWNSINGAENGFGMQSHPNAESRPSGCDERAVYEEALEHISQKRKEEDLPEGVMSISLLKHQKIALAWMLARENSSHCPGGILADDQGLGKTISTIALMQKERVQQCNFVSADSDSLELCAQSGTASTSRSAARPSAGTLVVVPASILKQWASEISAKVNESSRLSVLVYHGGPRTTDPAELAKYDVVVTTYTIVVREFDGGPLFKVKWYRVVLDEAQTIKNHWTKSAIGCCGLTAEKRWCLSGTPIQNKVDDVYSYFRFLKYQPYCQYDSFRLMIKEPISEGSIQFNKLQTVLNIVQLRRTKEALLDGEPIIKIPPKEIQLKKIKFTQKERQFYLDLEEGYRQKFKDFDDAGTIKQNYTNILVLLLRLRQACDHPVLLKEDNHANLTNPGSIVKAKELNKDEVKKMLKKLDGPHLACMVEKCAETPENAVITKCCHIFCYECVLESLSEEKVCPFCKRKLRAELVFSRPVLRLCESKSSATTSSPPADKSSAEADELSSICEKGYISSKVQAAVDTLNSIFNTHAVTDSDAIESSSSEIAPPKAIVFSQWTGMLDLLELSLNSNFIKFRRLDGSMSLDVRGAAVEEFKTDPEVRVMLMSLKAGNLGLNMTAASHVILLDPWWNPYAEDQAVDRAHRIGQTRPVTVTRFTVNDTVEDRILALQAKKRKMVESALGEKSGGISTRLTVEDLGYLFNI